MLACYDSNGFKTIDLKAGLMTKIFVGDNTNKGKV